MGIDQNCNNNQPAILHAETAYLIAAITIDPNTGRAANLDGFVAKCRNIIEVPSSPRPLSMALPRILEIARSADYRAEDRKTIIDALRDVRINGNIKDSCIDYELYTTEYRLRCVDHPDPTARSLPLSPSRHFTPVSPLGPRGVKPLRPIK